jgi:F-type H+-transporting ATPase subunit b
LLFLLERNIDSSIDKQVEPKVKAQSLLDAIPGNSLVSKTGIVTLGVGLSTVAISKELYVLNEETLVLIAFSSMAAYLYKSMKGTIAEWTHDNIEVCGCQHYFAPRN